MIPDYVEFGFAFDGPQVVHSDTSIYEIMERRVLREARDLEERGEIVIVGGVVRTKHERHPYVFVPVLRLERQAS